MTNFDCLIIGSGSAGAAAGLYCSRGGVSNALFTGPSFGGLLTTTYTVENYPGVYPAIGGYQLMETMINQAVHYGTVIKYETCNSIEKISSGFIIKTETATYMGKTLIFATGSNPRKLGIPREEYYENKGISYCAICDGSLYAAMDVAVVGGGNSALEEAIYLSRIAKTVHLIHRRQEFRGEKILQDQLLKLPNIIIHFNSTVYDILGNQEQLQEIIIENTIDQRKSNIKIEGLFIAIGHIPNTSLVKQLVNIDQAGYVKAQFTKTNTPGLFVAGDVQDSIYRQAVTAAASGCIAALEAIKFINSTQ